MLPFQLVLFQDIIKNQEQIIQSELLELIKLPLLKSSYTSTQIEAGPVLKLLI